MFGMKLKPKKLLKRKDFINSVDSKKIWSKAMTIPEIKNLIERLFEFKGDKKVFKGVVFTCKHFVNEGKSVTYISHKGNGDYECFCSDCEQELDLNSVMVLGLDEILTEKNSTFFNIEKGKYIYLKDGNWYEKDLDKNDEYFVWLFDIEDKIINENIRRNKELRSELSGIKIERYVNGCQWGRFSLTH